MSLFRRAALERRNATSSLPFGDSQPPTNGMLGGGAAGTMVTESTALQVAAVYGSVGVLSDALSTLPMQLLSSTDPASRKRLPDSLLLEQPYSEISRIDWLVEYTISLALRGNFFGQIISRDPDGFPTQIKPVHPDHARVTRNPDGTIRYEFYSVPCPINNVFHVRYLSVPGSLIGLNPIDYLKNTIGLARAAELYGGSFFANSATPSGQILFPDEVDDDEVKAALQAWLASHQGLNQANLPAIFSGGSKFEAIQITPEQSQFLETRGFSQTEISGMIFRVPPHMIGIIDRSTSWGTGIEQQELGFVRNTLGGYTRRLEEAFSALHPPGQVVRFDYDERLRGDKLSRYQAYSLGRLGGWLSSNDILAAEDMPPMAEGGDQYLVPVNTELLEQALKDLAAPPPPPPQLPAAGPPAQPFQPAKTPTAAPTVVKKPK